MKVKRVGFITTLVLLLSLVGTGVHCADESGEESVEMMGKIPEDATFFSFVDIRALRLDDDLEDIYENWEDSCEDTLEDYGIECGDVDCITVSEDIRLYRGHFYLSDIRDKLDYRDYDDSEYRDVEVWESPGISGKEWVALTSNLIIIGGEEGVKDCIRVTQGDKDSLQDNRDAKAIVDRLPSGIWVSISMEVEEGDTVYEGLAAGGSSFEKKDADTVRITAVFEFQNEDAAQGAIGEIEEDVEEEEGVELIYIDQDEQFAKVIADNPIEALEVMIGFISAISPSLLEQAKFELYQAQRAVVTCMADAGVGVLSSYNNTTGWDGSPGVIRANGCDAADYIDGTFKAHYLVNQNGHIVGAINDSWSGLYWDTSDRDWTDVEPTADDVMEARTELHQAQTAVAACMADASSGSLTSYNNTTGWDGGPGVITANGYDAADYLRGTFKAHYLVTKNGHIVGAINDSWVGLHWDAGLANWVAD